jgi:hypothetical protein
MSYHVYFPEAFIQLNLEIQNHPELMERMPKHIDKDAELQFAKMIAEAAAYVNVALDDTYDEALFIKIADIVTERLKKKREIIVTSGAVPMVEKGTEFDWGKHFIKEGKNERKE